MKAMVYSRYGSPRELCLEDVPTPKPGANEVLVRVHASSINSWDWDLLRGRPYLARLGAFRTPRFNVIGCDIAGRVEEVGQGATQFQAGDRVFGDISSSGWGGFAEYVSVQEAALAAMPDALSFERAAAIPQAGVLALQALRKAEPLEGQRVLIVGAGGGVGTIAVQMARHHGATVTAVDRSDKLEMLLSLGAERVIDYQHEDFARNGQAYDVIIDVVMQRSIFTYQRALAPGGRFVVVGGKTGLIAQTVLLGPLLARRSSKRLGLLRLLMHRPIRADLESIGGMVASGQISPVIDRTFPLGQLPDAFRYFGEGNAKGKVVISVVEHAVPTGA